MLKNHSLANKLPAPGHDPLDGLDDKALLALRGRIDAKMKIDLARMNLAEELGLQYQAGMSLLSNLEGAPPNQQAQVFNSVGKMLQDIIKSQKIVYNAERLKRFEASLLKVLGHLPSDSARTYFDLYGEFLKESPDALKELERISPGLIKK